MSAKEHKVELAEGVAVEYARTSGLLRVHGPKGEADIPLADLLNRLGVQAADVFPVRRYLLFAGRDDHRSGGMGDLVGLYDEEDEARAAFQRARLAIGSGLGWAHLIVMEPSGRLDRLCWFGREPDGTSGPDGDRPASPRPASPRPASPRPERRKAWSRRGKQQPEAAPAPPPSPAARQASAPSGGDDRPILAAFSDASAARPPRGSYRVPPVSPRGGRRRR